MDYMSVKDPDELFEHLDDSQWTIGDRIAYIERVIELELSGADRSAFELMLALHELDDVRTEFYRRGAPVVLNVPRRTPVNENIEIVTKAA